MTQFHINSKGVPAPCKATKGKCPFGTASQHFDTRQEAQDAADKENGNQYGVLSNVNSEMSLAEIEREQREKILDTIKTPEGRMEKALEMFAEEEVGNEIQKINNRIEKSEAATVVFQEFGVGPGSTSVARHFGSSERSMPDPVKYVEQAYKDGDFEDMDEEDVEFFREGARELKAINDDVSKLRLQLAKNAENFVDFEKLRDGDSKEEAIDRFKKAALSEKGILSAYNKLHSR